MYNSEQEVIDVIDKISQEYLRCEKDNLSHTKRRFVEHEAPECCLKIIKEEYEGETEYWKELTEPIIRSYFGDILYHF